MSYRVILNVIGRSAAGWARQNAALHAAGIAFYMVLSLAPLVLVLTTLATQVMPQSEVEWRLVAGVEKQVGAPAATVIREITINSQTAGYSRLATGFGVLITMFAASTVFLQLQTALNAMWELTPTDATARQTLVAEFKSRLISALVVITVALLLVGSLVVGALWAAIPHETLVSQVPQLSHLIEFTRLWGAPVAYTILFALTFKWLPKATIAWRDVLVGAFATALLFWLGNSLIQLYLVNSFALLIYGAAGSLVVFLLWVYYSAWIILFGAKFTFEYAAEVGRPVRPYYTPPRP